MPCANAFAYSRSPPHGARGAPQGVGDRSELGAGPLVHDHLRAKRRQAVAGFDERSAVHAPLLHRDHLVSGPVHDPRRHRCCLEQRPGLVVDVVLVDDAVGAGIEAGDHRLAGDDRVELVGGKPPFGP